MKHSKLTKKIEDSLEEIRRTVEILSEHQEGTFFPIDEIGEILKKERKVQGLTLKELAMLANVSLQTLVNIEKGQKNASLSRVEATLKVLGKGLYIK